MNRSDAKILLPIIAAYAEGKVVQYRTKRDGQWQSLGADVGFSLPADRYRIKPEKVEVVAWGVYCRETGDRRAMFASRDEAEIHVRMYVYPTHYKVVELRGSYER